MYGFLGGFGEGIGVCGICGGEKGLVATGIGCVQG